MAHSIFDNELAFFPYNVIEHVEVALQALAPHSSDTARDGVRIYRRPLNNGDDGDSIGIYPVLWDPIEDSVEMRGMAAAEPTRSSYPIQIESLVIDADEWAGIRAHSYFAALIRHRLHRSPYLQSTFTRDFAVSIGSTVERYQTHRVSGQTFMSSKSESMFSFLATTTLLVTTEIQ